MRAPSSRARGSAAVEILSMAPLMAAFLLVAHQLGSTYLRALRGMGEATSAAWSAVRSWELAHEDDGFARPCLEQMPQKSFRSIGANSRIGAGPFGRVIDPHQEVRIAVQPLCIP